MRVRSGRRCVSIVHFVVECIDKRLLREQDRTEQNRAEQQQDDLYRKEQGSSSRRIPSRIESVFPIDCAVSTCLLRQDAHECCTDLTTTVVLLGTGCCCCNYHHHHPLPTLLQTRRGMSTNSGSPSGSRGAGFLQRMASFGVGAGVTALATQVLILQKLEEANKDMLEKYKSLEARLDKMEKRR